MYWVLALLFVFRYTLQGLGQSIVPTFAGVMELCMRALAAIVLAAAWASPEPAWRAPPPGIGSCVPLAIAYYFTSRKLARSHEAGLPSLP